MLLRWLVSHVVQNAAQQGLRAFTEEGFTKTFENAQRNEGDDQANHVAIDMVLLFAAGVESGGFVDLLEHASPCRGEHCTGIVGEWSGRRIAIVHSGVGMKDSAAAAREVIEAFQPKWLISAGFAAALVDSVKRGDILLPNQVEAAGETSIEVGMKWVEKSVPTPGLHSGLLLTVDHLVRNRSEREQLRAAHSAVACDMETFAAAQVCREKGVRLLSVRVITDGVDDALPLEIEKMLEQNSWASRIGAATGAMFKRPSAIKDLWQVKQDAMKASDRLASFLTGVLSQLN